MEALLWSLVLVLFGFHSITGLEPVQIEQTYYIGGSFRVKGVSADYCVRYCRKLGNCWGADYFRYGGHCSVHMDDSVCDPDRRRFFEGADHFRVKECIQEEPQLDEEPHGDPDFQRTPVRLDNPAHRQGGRHNGRQVHNDNDRRPDRVQHVPREQRHDGKRKEGPQRQERHPSQQGQLLDRSSDGFIDSKHDVQEGSPHEDRQHGSPHVPHQKHSGGRKGVKPTGPTVVFMEDLERDDSPDGPHHQMPHQQHQDSHDQQQTDRNKRQHSRYHVQQQDFHDQRYHHHEDKQLAELKAHMDAKAYTHDCFLHIYESSYAYGGFIKYKNISLSRCADECTRHPFCHSLNYKKDGGLCAFLSTTQNVDHLVSSYCCHHVAVSCHNDSEITTTPGPLTSTQIPLSSTPVADVPNTTPLPNQEDTYPPYPYTLHTRPTYHTRRPHTGYPSPTKVPHIPRPDPEEPFIDGVCPFLEQKGTSRVGGLIQDDMNDIRTVEECVDYCDGKNVDNGPVICFSVDWNDETKDCFMFDTPDEVSMMNFTDKYIAHFKYNPCDSIPDLQCVVHGPVSYSQNTVVLGNLGANIAHTVEPCDTYCFYKYSFSATGGSVVENLERGCGADADDYMRWRQCVTPDRTPTSISTMCHCRGDVCNTVGYAALYQLYAYYPFDYDTYDLSGYNRHGYVEGNLKYTTLEKRSLRAAALFDGRTAVIVKAMQLTHISDVQEKGDLRVASAVSLWVNRMNDCEGSMTILSNAENRQGSSIEVYSDPDPGDATQHTITVSIKLNNQPYTVTSPPYPTGTWQFVCMNIDDSGAGDPSMDLYIGEDAQGPILVAQTPLPAVPKNIDVTAKDLTIGKQSGKGLVFPFKGVLDELHFFQGELTLDDITALMLQYNYYP